MKYFEGLTIENEIKARYKELAKKHHPDLGGCAETMKEVNNQYEKCITGMYQTSGKSITDIEELLKKDALLRERLDSIMYLAFDVDIEICGGWIWVTGNTKPYKCQLKAQGFFWAQKKGAWYWRSEENRSFNRKAMSLDEIRQKHGSFTVEHKKLKQVA